MQVEAYLLRLSKCLSPKNDSKQYNWNQVRKSDAYGVPAVFCITHIHVLHSFVQWENRLIIFVDISIFVAYILLVCNCSISAFAAV